MKNERRAYSCVRLCKNLMRDETNCTQNKMQRAAQQERLAYGC